MPKAEKPVRREVSSVREIWVRRDTGKKTTDVYAKANPKNVRRGHEPYKYMETLK